MGKEKEKPQPKRGAPHSRCQPPSPSACWPLALVGVVYAKGSTLPCAIPYALPAAAGLLALLLALAVDRWAERFDA